MHGISPKKPQGLEEFGWGPGFGDEYTLGTEGPL